MPDSERKQRRHVGPVLAMRPLGPSFPAPACYRATRPMCVGWHVITGENEGCTDEASKPVSDNPTMGNSASIGCAHVSCHPRMGRPNAPPVRRLRRPRRIEQHHFWMRRVRDCGEGAKPELNRRIRKQAVSDIYPRCRRVVLFTATAPAALRSAAPPAGRACRAHYRVPGRLRDGPLCRLALRRLWSWWVGRVNRSAG